MSSSILIGTIESIVFLNGNFTLTFTLSDQSFGSAYVVEYSGGYKTLDTATSVAVNSDSGYTNESGQYYQTLLAAFK